MFIPKYNLITCPKCKAQYTVQEIFTPDIVVSKCKDIIKTPDGELVGCNGIEEPFEEEYACDFCYTRFKIKGNFVWNTEIIVEEE